MKTIIRLIQDERGTTVLEYAVISGVISFATITATAALGIKILMML